MSPFHLLFAQAAVATPGNSMAQTIFLFGSLGLIWYFLLIRPQQKQKKDHETGINALAKGDEVVTAGRLVCESLPTKAGTERGHPVEAQDARGTPPRRDAERVGRGVNRETAPRRRRRNRIQTQTSGR